MMNKWNYQFGMPLDDGIRTRLEALGMVHSAHPAAGTAGFEKDTFTSDGYPVQPRPDTVYPSLLHLSLSTPVSESLTQIDPVYRQQASLAALKWTEKVFVKGTLHWDFDGLYLTEQIDGTTVNFCFPDTSILVTEGQNVIPCMVIPLPESRQDDEYWEKGMIPQYAMQQAQLALWCSRMYAARYPQYVQMEKALLVRITGNSPSDVQIRTVSYDQRQAEKLLRRVARAVAQSNAKGIGLHDGATTMAKISWKDRKQAELDNAFYLDSDDFHDLIVQYMSVRSGRKQAEEKGEMIKNEMGTIAIRLASLIGAGSASGVYSGTDATYTVSHNAKRETTPNITADLLRQLAPEYAESIHTAVIPRGAIKIEAL